MVSPQVVIGDQFVEQLQAVAHARRDHDCHVHRDRSIKGFLKQEDFRSAAAFQESGGH